MKNLFKGRLIVVHKMCNLEEKKSLSMPQILESTLGFTPSFQDLFKAAILASFCFSSVSSLKKLENSHVRRKRPRSWAHLSLKVLQYKLPVVYDFTKEISAVLRLSYLESGCNRVE